MPGAPNHKDGRIEDQKGAAILPFSCLCRNLFSANGIRTNSLQFRASYFPPPPTISSFLLSHFCLLHHPTNQTFNLFSSPSPFLHRLNTTTVNKHRKSQPVLRPTQHQSSHPRPAQRGAIIRSGATRDGAHALHTRLASPRRRRGRKNSSARIEARPSEKRPSCHRLERRSRVASREIKHLASTRFDHSGIPEGT